MVFQQFIDVLIFSFLNFVDLDLLSQFQFFLELFILSFVSLNQVYSIFIKLAFQFRNFKIKVLLLSFDRSGVSDLVANVLILVLLFVFDHVLLIVSVVLLLLVHELGGLVSDLLLVVAVLVLQMLDLLLVDLDLGLVLLL